MNRRTVWNRRDFKYKRHWLRHSVISPTMFDHHSQRSRKAQPEILVRPAWSSLLTKVSIHFCCHRLTSSIHFSTATCIGEQQTTALCSSTLHVPTNFIYANTTLLLMIGANSFSSTTSELLREISKHVPPILLRQRCSSIKSYCLCSTLNHRVLERYSSIDLTAAA